MTLYCALAYIINLIMGPRLLLLSVYASDLMNVGYKLLTEIMEPLNLDTKEPLALSIKMLTAGICKAHDFEY